MNTVDENISKEEESVWALLTKTINVNILSVGLTTVAAIIMCVIAYINNNIAKKTLDLQKEYNRISICPKCDIVCSETDGIIKISLYNYGQGTMVINHLDILNKDTESLFHNMYEIIPENIGISYYSLETKGRNIKVGGHITLIQINRGKLDDEQYKKVRRILAKYSITVYFKGIYEQEGDMAATKDLGKLFGTVYRENGENI